MSAWVVVMLMLGQSDGGLSTPPLPPEVVPEAITFPRVIRSPGEVCIEALDESGAVKRECKCARRDRLSHRRLRRDLLISARALPRPSGAAG